MTDIEDTNVDDLVDQVQAPKLHLKFKPQKMVRSQIISASRRTDIPAFYMEMMIAALKIGWIEVTSPYGVKSVISLSPDDVKCIVWWSKDYAVWLQQYSQNRELFAKYGHVFNFTLTGDEELERGLRTTLAERLEQLQTLSALFGPRSIKLRFDPIVLWTDLHSKSDRIHNNFGHFPEIVKVASELGIKEIIFAFCIAYPKVIKRFTQQGKTLLQLTISQQKEVLDHLIPIAESGGIQLKTCCGSQLIGYKGVSASKCIDGEQIEALYGALKTTKKDTGQRKECNCVVSRDIGSYQMMCRHGCVYCYANGRGNYSSP